MYYEHIRSGGDRYIFFSISEKEECNFPLHLHTSFELLTVQEGTLVVQVGTTEYEVKSGESILVFPMKAHGFHARKYTKISICIFSKDFVPELEEKYIPIFKSVPDFAEKYNLSKDNPFALKALLYQVAAAYSEGEAIQKVRKDEDFLTKLVVYINDHFTEDISLKMLSKQFGYNYRYMSGLINKHFGMNFSRVISQFRIGYASRLVRKKELSITEIAQKCGFETLRNFNRVFKQITGMTPKEMRGQ